MSQVTLIFIQLGIGVILGVLSYLIKRLIERIDQLDKELTAIQLAFAELKTAAVKRNGFDNRIERVRQEIERARSRLEEHEKSTLKEFSVVKRHIVRILALNK